MFGSCQYGIYNTWHCPGEEFPQWCSNTWWSERAVDESLWDSKVDEALIIRVSPSNVNVNSFCCGKRPQPLETNWKQCYWCHTCFGGRKHNTIVKSAKHDRQIKHSKEHNITLINSLQNIILKTSNAISVVSFVSRLKGMCRAITDCQYVLWVACRPF